jgi:hypothetical protein
MPKGMPVGDPSSREIPRRLVGQDLPSASSVAKRDDFALFIPGRELVREPSIVVHECL